ncbi:hypothetical protein Pmani_034588 [Petrolisthes manimaculis]|uniref:Uncharacterized protein n=1 Tax=Petrolisthes manimaculis TaxID=1843537 RepID=A0AAE1TRF4_9EUCA|nr:hypothetical protein Pmani_034588 [Petrolisthes manimaculis]
MCYHSNPSLLFSSSYSTRLPTFLVSLLFLSSFPSRILQHHQHPSLTYPHLSHPVTPHLVFPHLVLFFPAQPTLQHSSSPRPSIPKLDLPRPACKVVEGRQCGRPRLVRLEKWWSSPDKPSFSFSCCGRSSTRSRPPNLPLSCSLLLPF